MNKEIQKLEKIKHLLILTLNSHRNQDTQDLVEALQDIDVMIKEIKDSK
jgi:hypothetical protein